MAEKMIEEIKATEQKADKIVSDANIKAAEIVSNAEAKAKQIRDSALVNAHKESARIISTADNEAYKVKTKAAADNQTKADELKAKSAAGLTSAVALVIKQIIPE